MLTHHILLFSIRYSHSLVVIEGASSFFNYYLRGVVEENSRRIVTELVAEAVLARIVDELCHINAVVYKLIIASHSLREVS